MSLEFFEAAAPDLRDELPARWATGDPASEVSITCEALGTLIDELSESIEQIHRDQSLTNASYQALLSEWAVLYGASNEQLPLSEDALRAYLRARAAEDGTLESCELTLLALLVGPINGFEPGIVGLFFPSDGSGLTFPADGSGLTFPDGGWLAIEDDPTNHVLHIRVLDSLVFDRAAFARAAARFNPAHYFPPDIVETPTP